MAENEETESDEKKDDGSKQLDLFASKQDKVADKLEAVATAVSQQAAALQQALARPQEPAKVDWLSDEQVWHLVEEERINNAQAMAYLNKKARAEAREEARRETESQMNNLRAQGRDQQTANKIQAYVKAIPDLANQGSSAWKQVATRFRELVQDDGYEPTLKTELIALREIYGKDPSEHERVNDRTKERATRGGESTGGATAREARRTPLVKDDAGDLPTEYRNYLQKMVNLKQMSGPNDPKYKAYVKRVRAKIEAA